MGSQKFTNIYLGIHTDGLMYVFKISAALILFLIRTLILHFTSTAKWPQVHMDLYLVAREFSRGVHGRTFCRTLWNWRNSPILCLKKNISPMTHQILGSSLALHLVMWVWNNVIPFWKKRNISLRTKWQFQTQQTNTLTAKILLIFCKICGRFSFAFNSGRIKK